MDVARISRGGDSGAGNGEWGMGNRKGSVLHSFSAIATSQNFSELRGRLFPNPHSRFPPEAAGLRSQTV
ncbi:hypothetical protein FHY14_000797 [Xanthomonas arboricola]|nr:hypothetical protein [Xanthomonas arboricola]